MGEWKDISTAPRDGEIVLLWDKNTQGVCQGRFDEAGLYWNGHRMDKESRMGKAWFAGLTYGHLICIEPSHWMELPAPPLGEGKQ